ncbi:hypothetical protein ACOSQ3_032392 [Xanthoceras sorbifolium]
MHKTSPEPAQPAVPKGGNLNAAQMAKLFLDQNSRNEVGQAASREDPVRQQRQGVRFHGPIARDRAQGCSLVRLPLSRPQVLEAFETVGGASQYAINVESLT